MVGLYAIINNVNGKKYYGSSIDIDRRFIEHKRHLKNNVHHCKHLQNSYNIHGVDAFEFTVLELCSVDELESKENDLLKQPGIYNTFKTAFMQAGSSHPMYGKKHTDEARLKIKNARSRQVIKHSAETKLKMSVNNARIKITNEQMKKMIAGRGPVWNKGLKTGISPANKMTFSADFISMVTEKYNSGSSIEKIRNELNLSWDTIKSILVNNGIVTRNISQQRNFKNAGTN